MEIAAIILAGGKSTRFAEDKLIYLYNNKPIISYPISESKKITENIFIVTNELEYEKIKDLDNVKFIFDDQSLNCKGSARGIATALEKIESNYYLIMPGDIPWINSIALNNLIEYSMRTELLVSPIIYTGIVSPLFMSVPKKYSKKIIELCNDYSILASRPSNFIRGNESLLIGSYHLINNPKVFYDVDTKHDLNLNSKGLPRKIIHLKSYENFIEAIKNFKNGNINEAFKNFITESKIYKKNKLYSLELSTLIDAFIINKSELIQKRINWLRKKIGRNPKEI
ncbi:MAG: hypothetical protein C0171_05530 [Caldisphaera sp.]|uniref:molybdenum cofactor guanylyltransferase n=1 Tax=Caldisphaera sp. TaxID=2060322 RepID=UPI000CC960F2|nr:MAG: hypothetical protein C0171_05530 [Caldisphaera sp.]